MEGIIGSLKGDMADMVWFFGPAPSIKAIFDKLDSLYSSVSTFDIMMQGFYRESQGRSESFAHHITRLEGKLNEIQVKQPNQASEAETTGYIWDCLFYGLRKPPWKTIHAKFLWVTFWLWLSSIWEHRSPPLLRSSVNNMGMIYILWNKCCSWREWGVLHSLHRVHRGPC